MKRTVRAIVVAAAGIAVLTGCGDGMSEDYKFSYDEGHRLGSKLGGSATPNAGDCDALLRATTAGLSADAVNQDSKDGFLAGCRDGVSSPSTS